jgi:hypothetical protein
MSSVFASRVTETVPVGEHTVTIRKLNPKQLSAAAQAQQLRSIESLKAFGGPAFMKELQGLTSDEKAKEQAAEAERRKGNPLASFDRDTLLLKGIVGWSFTEEDGTAATIDAAHVEDLDDDVSEQLADAILKLAKPSLYVPAAEAQKNG